MNGCLTCELHVPSAFCQGTREQPHWKRKFVSGLMNLAFNSSSVKLQATTNGHSKTNNYIILRLTSDQKISVFSQQFRSPDGIYCDWTSPRLVLLPKSDRIVSALIHQK